MKTFLAVLFAGWLVALTQSTAAGSAQCLQFGPKPSLAITLAQGGSRFNRCMQRCFDQGYNTRLCPSKCGGQ